MKERKSEKKAKLELVERKWNWERTQSDTEKEEDWIKYKML